ncbi:MAG: type II secretion system protein [Eubacteriales bacterium]|nr:type II secretion system protein [Eubacteriales bacterium]
MKNDTAYREKYKSERGFTLAELLIVVAIIAVLVAISIPIFTSQLEKSREATDMANVRGAYAEVMAAAISNDKSAAFFVEEGKWEKTVTLKQKQAGWQSKKPVTIGGYSSGPNGEENGEHWIGAPADGGGTCKVTYTESPGVVFYWSGDGSGGGGGTPSYTYTQGEFWSYTGNLNNGNGLGGTINSSTISNSWSRCATAVNETLSASVGQKITLPSLSDVGLSGKYVIGYYVVDPSTNKIVYDSGQKNFGGTYDIPNNLPGNTATDVKIYLQIINNQTNTAVSNDVAADILSKITIS